MRKIVISGVAAALAFGLTACNSNDKPSAATPPSSPGTSAPAPSNSATPGETSTPGSNSTPGNGSDNGGSGTPRAEHTPPTQQPGQQISSKWGRLRYVAPGKFSVGNVVFFTATDTRLTIAGGDCPDGTPPGDSFKCGIDGIDDWAQAAPHNVNVHFSGQTATSIQETQ